KGKTTNALKGLMSLAPSTATVVRDGAQVVVPVQDVAVGDIFVVKAGDSVPVDGIVIEGSGAVDESALTGESIPVDKMVGDCVVSATINQSGYMRCRATNIGNDTTLSKIVKLVSDASATKAPIAGLADKVSGVFVPIVIAIAVITFVVWIILGTEFSTALTRGIAVLVISCPCALGLATPVAIMVGNGVAAKNGVLFKSATALENTGRVQIVALDKTGTITTGAPCVTDIMPAMDVTKEELLTLAYSVERLSEHPLARAVVEYAEMQRVVSVPAVDFRTLVGNGVTATVDGNTVVAGSYSMISSQVDITHQVRNDYGRLAQQGNTPLLFAKNGQYIGMIAVADTIKKDSASAIRSLHNMGISVVMLTGDNQHTADAIGKQVGVDYVVSGVLPQGKANVVSRLKKYGTVAMVGDGINDAPALTTADIGIAIDAGTDIAIDSADVVLMNSGLSDAVTAINLSRATLKNIKENLFWAFIYNIIGIPLAAGVWIPIFGWSLNPMFGAAAMSLSSICVVTNALRLNLFNPNRIIKAKNKIIHFDIKEVATMTKTVSVEGMMCSHCEATVKKAFESLPQVDSAIADHTANTVELMLNTDLDDTTIRSVVEEAGYKYLG
ncbi:MAG: heavy metal translocating P-type ATPase, partial [Eubacterium sp.]